MRRAMRKASNSEGAANSAATNRVSPNALSGAVRSGERTFRGAGDFAMPDWAGGIALTQEEIAAYADGELEGEEAARVLLAVAANPSLMRMVQLHRQLRERIGAEFAPILDQEVPERLAVLLQAPDEARERRGAGVGPQSDPTPEPSEEPTGQKQRVASPPVWLALPLLAAAVAAATAMSSAEATPSGPAVEERLPR